MKKIPFYRNHTAERPETAIYQMLFDYFLQKKPSRAEVLDFLGSPRSSESLKPALERLGFDVRTVSKPTLKDINSLLKDDNLILLGANQPLLVIQREGDGYIAHDPGPQPQEYRRLTREEMSRLLESAKVREAVGFNMPSAHTLRRLDQYVVSRLPRLSRSYAAKLVEEGRVLVNGRAAKPGYKIRQGDEVTIDYDEAALEATPEIDLPVIYEDDDCLVINKPAGILTHAQGKFINEATVATFLRGRLKVDGLAGERAGIVHRLDRATSGVMICAKNQPALAKLQKQFSDRSVQKTYLAVARGHLAQPEAVIDMPIERNPKAPATFKVGQNGKPAVTRYKVLKESGLYSLIELWPKTGRTHQLRVHLQKLGHPIVGDPLYGGGKYGDRMYLHAEKLSITLPDGNQMTFIAPMPEEFGAIMEA